VDNGEVPDVSAIRERVKGVKGETGEYDSLI
jgi:hypothetical protein